MDGLLVLARVDGDVRSDDRVDLFEIVRTAADAYEDPRIVVHGGPTPLRGDARLLDVLIRNLLSNALRHTPTGGEVVVAVTPVSAGARLEVRDNGEGIPASAAPHVFDRFYRVDDARDRARGGAGLGLSIVQAIALVHGGRASLRSAPGAGTKVTVDFSDAGRPADGRSAP